MRIIAGMAKGRNLFSPEGGTRPTSDRAREAIFSTLESEYGSLEDLQFLDLFAGSGAMSVEALSRGAAVVHLVEKDEKAVRVARANLALLENLTGVGSATLFTSSVGKFVEQEANISYDVIFLDPPYDYPISEIEKILESLLRKNYLKKSSTLALELNAKGPKPSWPLGLRELKVRKYGAASIYYAELEELPS
jgi:16S rRNA (guanine966-N2)-methyltransferase